jgi:hypothetical protein
MKAIDRAARLLAVCLWLPAGCAWMRPAPAIHPVMAADAAQPQPDPAEAADPQPQTDLEAIEEFLERTRDYTLNSTTDHPAAVAGSPVPYAPVPAPPTVPNEEPVLRSDLNDTDVGALANAQMVLDGAPPPEPTLALPVLQSISIVQPGPAGPGSTVPQATPTTNAAMEVQPSSPAPSLDDMLVQLLHELESAADPDAAWRLRFAQLALDRRDDLVRPVLALTAESNELMEVALAAPLAVRDLMRNPTATGDKALAAADGLRRRLADRADPAVMSVALCRQVATFGVYDEMAPSEFIAGRAIHTIVYSEVRNLRSKLNDDDKFETRLATRLELLTAGGNSVWQREEPTIIDTCRRNRTDFFIAQRVTLPPTLPAGDYVLKVFVEDQLSRRAGEASRPLTVLAPLSIAKRP